MIITAAQWVADPTTDRTYAVKLTVDGRTWCVPIQPENRHYKAFLEWQAEGNTPTAAED